MDKEAIKATLRAHDVELKRAGIVHLHLHGSVVRGEARPDSDIDLAAVFDRVKSRSILAEVGLKNMLTEILGVEAGLANADKLRERVQENFDREAELVFQVRRISEHTILQSIKDIASDAKGMDFEAFHSDPKTVRAVERSLQIISEAAIRLGGDAEALCPDQPWHNIRGIGNWLRHQYDRNGVGHNPGRSAAAGAIGDRRA